MKRFLTLALACACLLASDIGAAEKDKGDDDAQTIVYLGDSAPILIKLHLRIDGKPHREAWLAFMDQLYDYLDTKKTGKLTAREAAAAPPAAALASAAGFFGGRPGGGGVMDADKDGVVTKAELREFYRKGGMPPFQISSTPRQTGVIRINALTGRTGGSGNSPEAVNTRLFALLDTDKDGKLSKKELDAAETTLGKLDRDEDEIVTTDELLDRRTGSNDGQVLAVARLRDATQVGDRRFHVLADGKTDRTLGGTLLARYGKDKKRLDVKKVGLVELDRDNDGWLDAEELARLSEVAPQIELTIRLGKRGDKEQLVEVTKKGKALKKVETTNSGVALMIDNARIDLRGPDQQEGGFQIDFRAQYRNQFTMADADNNGYLDKKEAARNPLFGNLFAVMDRDGDGQLFEKEMLAYLDEMDKLRKAAGKCCCSLVIRDEGKGLFDVADSDGDARLSIRELRNLAKAWLKLDRDDDGQLALTEVPRSYRGAFEEGSVAGGPSGLRAVAFVGDMNRPPPPPVRAKGPTWFRKMDRNRDGDLSRKEWLGTDEEFKEIDADQDGLISVAEAEAFDKMKRDKE